MLTINWHTRLIVLIAATVALTSYASANEPAPLEDVAVETVLVQETSREAAPAETEASTSGVEEDTATEPAVSRCKCCPNQKRCRNRDCNIGSVALSVFGLNGIFEEKVCRAKRPLSPTEKMKGAYKGVFYDNDFSYLGNPCYQGPSFLGDGLKGLHCGRLDIGGEARVRFHSEDNIRNGYSGDDDTFWLTRLRLFANYRANEYIRLYGEYLYADSAGEIFPNRLIEENRGEIQNLFIDTRLLSNFTLRLGRQELLYGDQRLISPLDWANTRRTFDGARFLYTGDIWNVDGFFVHPVNRTRANESKIDDTNENVDFFGLYGSRDTSFGTLDLYYLGLDDSDADFSYHTIGKRVSRDLGYGWKYKSENGYQFGRNTDGSNHSAVYSTNGVGRQLNLCTRCGVWKPTIWFLYDRASGEKDGNRVGRGDDGFDHLFPLAHKYLGLMDLFGRRNIRDFNVQMVTPVMGNPNVTLLVWYHYFRLIERTTPYDVNMQPINTVASAGDRDLGHEIDLLLNVDITPRSNVLLGYSFFSAGDYYDTTAGVPTNQDAQFFYMQYQTRF